MHMTSDGIMFFMNIKFGIITFIMISSLVALIAITYAVDQHYKRHHQNMPSSLVLASTAGIVSDIAVSAMAYVLPLQALSKMHNSVGVMATISTSIFNIIADISIGVALLLFAGAGILIPEVLDKEAHQKNQHFGVAIVAMCIMTCLGGILAGPVNTHLRATASNFEITGQYNTSKTCHKYFTKWSPKDKTNQHIKHAITHYNGMNNGKFMQEMHKVMPDSIK